MNAVERDSLDRLSVPPAGRLAGQPEVHSACGEDRHGAFPEFGKMTFARNQSDAPVSPSAPA